MPLQTDNLVMVGLGVLGDSPPDDSLQPALVDGIHLRWSFRRDLGFPWYGFYLFRRLHRPGSPRCLGQILSRMQAGTWPAARLNTPDGQITSDKHLVFTDDFPAVGSTEFDLRAREYLNFTLNPAQPAYRIEVHIGFRVNSRADGEDGDGTQGEIKVQALRGDFIVDEQLAHGQPGQVVTVTLESDLITAIEVSGGEAALVDLCLYFVFHNATAGWQVIPDFQYAMCLPVRHPQYPCSPQPTDETASEMFALSRVRYGSTTVWAGAPFAELHEALVDLVEDGPAGLSMAEQNSQIVGTATPPDPEAGPPTMLEQYPLELVLFASLHPAMAQMIGLYWADQTVGPDHSYDYLIVADHTKKGNKDPITVLGVIRTEGFTNLDGYIVFDKRMEPASPLAPPDDVRCYALPGTTVAAQDGSLLDATNNAGLRWDLERLAPGVLKPGAALMYHVWRDERGDADTPDAAGSYTLATPDPVLVAESIVAPGLSPARPADWPPFPLQHIDRALDDGWYSYRVSGIDIFGRHSPNSADARWFQWTPAPQPEPWYYVDPPADEDPPADIVIHPSAVRLLDKMGPPPPHAVEAFALDPADPTLLRDTLYEEWHATLSDGEKQNLVGLRVRWRWTEAHARQAPDTREFRIYLQPDHPNALVGRITNVAPASATDTESDIQTDIDNPHGADAFIGAWLRVGANAFRVLGSGASPLGLRVRNIGAGHKVAPPAGACTLTIPRLYNTGHVSASTGSPVVMGTDTLWTQHLVGMIFEVVGEFATYTVEAVNSSTELVLDRSYEEAGAVSKPYSIGFPLYTNFTVPVSWQERVYVVPYDEHVTATTDGAGRPLRDYEVIIPADGDTERGGLQLATSLAAPIRYAHIGVSAADDKHHTADDPKWATGDWGGGDRFGNEGPVSPPAKIFVVRRTPPPTPTVSADSERVYASPADYHSRSFYTFRWVPSPNLRTHVFRALDDAVFEADWGRRATDTSDLDPTQTQQFPSEWDATKRQQIAAELNHLNALDHDADKAQAMNYYRALSNDGLRAVAGLPGNASAFAQLTIQALDPDNAANANRLGPDNPPTLAIDPNLRAWTDTLDGRSTSRWFYRAEYVDAVHNRSVLSLSSPPVYLRDVVPPRAPAIVRVDLDDGEATVVWASNREPDLASYRLYRGERGRDDGDVRTMQLVHALPVADGDPAARPAEVQHVDTGLVGGQRYVYRLVAVDIAGNVSAPAEPFKVVGVDRRPPEAPALIGASWVVWQAITERVDPWPVTGVVPADRRPALRLRWGSGPPGGRFVLTRRARGELRFRPVPLGARLRQATPDTVEVVDPDASTDAVPAYRLFAFSAAGVRSATYTEFEVPLP